MVGDGVLGTSFVEALADVRGKVGEELLGQGVGPFSNTGGRGGVKGGDQGEERLKHVGGCMVGLLPGGLVKP